MRRQAKKGARRMNLVKCPHCSKSVPAANAKCHRCGKPLRRKVSFWRHFGISGFGYILVLGLGSYLTWTKYNWGWAIMGAGILLLGLRVLRIVAVKK
jgi:hypothetical protein